MREDCLLSRIMHHDLQLSAQHPTTRVKMWSRLVLNMFAALGQHAPAGETSLSQFVNSHGLDSEGGMLPIPEEAVWRCWAKFCCRPWRGLHADPRQELHHAKLCTYDRWFAVDSPFTEATALAPGRDLTVPKYVQHTAGIPFGALKQLMRLRTGAHHLAVETGRWTGLARTTRLCTMCSYGSIEDELHLLFECPAYEGLRESHSEYLFSPHGGVRACRKQARADPAFIRMFANQHPLRLARYVQACLDTRKAADHNLLPYFAWEEAGEDGGIAGLGGGYSLFNLSSSQWLGSA